MNYADPVGILLNRTKKREIFNQVQFNFMGSSQKENSTIFFFSQKLTTQS